MTVTTERTGAVTTVILSRPEVRNAVDVDTAQALADAFRAFDADDEASVAVLYGDGGTFCAGADLKAVATGRPNRISEECVYAHHHPTADARHQCADVRPDRRGTRGPGRRARH